jgi:type IV pilus assembly protein PilP
MAVSLVLAACVPVNNHADLQAYVDDVKSRPGVQVEPVPVFQPYEGFIYGAASMRSPFDKPVVIDLDAEIIPVDNVVPDFEREPELLEGQALSELHMKGMVFRAGFYEAFIQDGLGEVHRVKVGNHLGRNYGRVVSISEDQLQLMEIVPSGNGGWIERPQTLMSQQ